MPPSKVSTAALDAPMDGTLPQVLDSQADLLERLRAVHMQTVSLADTLCGTGLYDGGARPAVEPSGIVAHAIEQLRDAHLEVTGISDQLARIRAVVGS